jgi:hypothetical protein
MKFIHSISLLFLSTATISGVISAPVLEGATDVETTSNDSEIMKRQNCVPAEDVNTVESTPANSTLAKRNYDGVSYTYLRALEKKEHLLTFLLRLTNPFNPKLHITVCWNRELTITKIHEPL